MGEGHLGLKGQDVVELLNDLGNGPMLVIPMATPPSALHKAAHLGGWSDAQLTVLVFILVTLLLFDMRFCFLGEGLQ